ncbi:type I methionyl aminopeptidase [Saccharopolyspora hordei]|uniref:Methionine aminopeptidase n=1 Tax=Saccharopolyspora hordei TaxID=1838 RepID=A0A853APU5_9PSEU|nr:methionyl aminopeptidase [Saccharopolyspora hordei]
MIELKTASEIDDLRATGHLVARTLDTVRAHAQVGTALRDLDALARDVLTDAGAHPVHHSRAREPFPGAISTSVNDAIVRGVPDHTRLTDGDLLSVSCAARLHGWVAAAAITVIVGTAQPGDTALVRTADDALADGISAARPGARTGDLSHAIGVVGRSAGYGVPAGLGGHGVGRDLREHPPVPNDGHPGTGVPLRPGVVLTVEPVLLAGGSDTTDLDDNGWTMRSGDGSRAAHVGHTVAITADGPLVLTTP